MTGSIERLAYATLLPAVDGLETTELVPLLDRGCRAVLLGETRAEYLARAMSPERVAAESAELVRVTIAALRAHASGDLLVAIDHEVVGIRRFDHLLPPDAPAEGLRDLGVNVALGPIVDVVRGENPWLSGRNLGSDPAVVAASGRAAVEELQAAGVAAVAKHYPGHPVLSDDPAVSPAVLLGPLDGLEEPFEAVVAAGVRGIMLGPAVVEAVDPTDAASCSRDVVQLARERLGFHGTLVSDDLDAAGILRGRTVGEAAVASLGAGADLLLVAAAGAAECAEALTRAVADGLIPEERLAEAAANVGRLEMERSSPA
jgi:beta-N-acetylhexosaminidase